MEETRKKITIVLPSFNEEENIEGIYNTLNNLFNEKLIKYDYDYLFIDNHSKDNTREIIRNLSKKDKHIKAIFNAKNFGQFNSPFYAMIHTISDATILMATDFQDPIDLIPTFVKEWEDGYKICAAQKKKSNENAFLLFFKKIYYSLIKKFSNVDQIPMFTGFGLYDKEFINILKDLNDPTPFLRGIVAEYGYKVKIIPYTQGKRKNGKTSNNFLSLYDAAMLSFTSYTKMGLRIATFFGFICSMLSLLIGIIYLIMKLIWWDRFPAGTIPMLLGMLFLGSIQIFFIGLLGEYILSMNQRIMNRPLVIEEERINFTDEI
ncbi:MAG: glycosyltransferase family 2 protein [Eubacteriales bacterium]|nr:glycosyltransferase family 2 protein [Eubacteriales bacterium]